MNKIAAMIIMAAEALCALGLPPDGRTVRELLGPLEVSAPREHDTAMTGYCSFYGLHFPGSTHSGGTFRSGRDTLVAQVWEPGTTRGTVVVIHGYFDHTGLLKYVIGKALEKNFRVAAFDLPGHGLSSGARASIGDFCEYRDALSVFLNVLAPSCTGPLILAGHSAGCAVLYYYLSVARDTRVMKAIFIAPLVHPAFWTAGRIAYRIVSPFSSTTFRWYRNSSHDRAFLAFVKRDPLQSRTHPLAWTKALYAWNERIRAYAPADFPAVIIQGDRDETVAWRYNIAFFRKKIPRLSVHIIPGARHHLPNESAPYRSEFLRIFSDNLP